MKKYVLTLKLLKVERKQYSYASWQEIIFLLLVSTMIYWLLIMQHTMLFTIQTLSYPTMDVQKETNQYP